MKRIGFILLLSSFCWAVPREGTQQVVVTNDPSMPVNMSCVSGCSGGGGSSSASSTFTLVNTATITFNGVGQPTTSTSTYIINPTTTTFNGIGQPVTSTSTQVTQSTVAVTNVNGQNLSVSIAAGSIANTGFNVNNTPAVSQSGPWAVLIQTPSVAVPIISTTPTTLTASTVGVLGVGGFFNATGSTVGVAWQNLQKGTQASTGTTVQELKDSGRIYVVLVATGVAGVTTEALFTFSQNKQGVNTDGVTTYTVTSGKTLRIQGLYCSNRDGTTTISWSRAVIRHNTGGACTATSPKVVGIEVGDAAALAGGTGYADVPFPDGIEIFGNGTQAICVSHLDQANTNVVTCSLVGYEY